MRPLDSGDALLAATLISIVMNSCGPSRELKSSPYDHLITPPDVQEINSLFHQLSADPIVPPDSLIEKDIQNWGPWAVPYVERLPIKFERFNGRSIGRYFNVPSPLLYLTYGAVDTIDFKAMVINFSEQFTQAEPRFMNTDERLFGDEPINEFLQEFGPAVQLLGYRWLQDLKEEFIDYTKIASSVVNHELTHYLVSDPRFGIKSHPCYDGPTEEEIKQDIIRIMHEPSLVDTVNLIQRHYLDIFSSTIVKDYGSIEDFILADLDSLEQSVASKKNMIDSLVVNRYTDLSITYNLKTKTPLAFKNDCFSDEEQEFLESLQDISYDELMNDHLELLGKTDPYTTTYVFKELPYFTLEITYMFRSLSTATEIKIKRQGLFKDILEKGIKKQELASTWRAYMTVFYQKLMVHEIEARRMDGLMDLIFEGVRHEKWPLNEKDLEFLGKYSIDGKPLFKENIEKYRLGLQMIEDGFKPKEVREMLKYARAFIYKGQEYNWPGNDFKFNEPIKVLHPSQ